MTKLDQPDEWLEFLLAPQQVEPDRQFVERTLQLVAADAAYRSARRRLVADWLWTMASLAGLMAGLAVFSRLSVFAPVRQEGLLSVAAPLVLVVALWLYASSGLEQLSVPLDRSGLAGARR